MPKSHTWKLYYFDRYQFGDKSSDVATTVTQDEEGKEKWRGDVSS